MKPILALLVAATLVPATPAAARSRSLFGASAGSYVNSRGRSVRSPQRSLFSSLGSTAKCRDGSSSYSRRASGSCSGHGGVARFR